MVNGLTALTAWQPGNSGSLVQRAKPPVEPEKA